MQGADKGWDIFKIWVRSNEKKIWNDQEKEDRMPDKLYVKPSYRPRPQRHGANTSAKQL